MRIWEELLHKLNEGISVYLLVVIDHHGSTPGRSGFKMLVGDDGYISGSIGGGIMEYRLVEEAKMLLADQKNQCFIKRQVHKGHKDFASGMICSGEQTIAFVPLNYNSQKTIESIIKSKTENQFCPIELSPSGLVILIEIFKEKISRQITDENRWNYRENIGFEDSLFIIGGGHVSMALSDLFVKLDFHVAVLDDRENLNTLELNNSAHRKTIIDFNHIGNHVPEGSNVYVAIMTNKFTDDKLVLTKLIKKDFRYLGVLGSKAKLAKMWEAMINEGFSEKELSEVSAPIGMMIKSQTPMEIAVSIAGEIIKLRNENL